jgi:hypothetical protein
VVPASFIVLQALVTTIINYAAKRRSFDLIILLYRSMKMANLLNKLASMRECISKTLTNLSGNS